MKRHLYLQLPLAFLSTHPSDKRRIDAVANAVPSVMPLDPAVPHRPDCH